MIRSKLHLINAAHVFIIVGLTSQEKELVERERGGRGQRPVEEVRSEQIIIIYSTSHTSIDCVE